MRKHNLYEWGLTGLRLSLVFVLESKSVMGALRAVSDHMSAYQHAALSVVSALLAFVFSAMAGRYKIDVRPYVRASASLARLVSIAFLIIPTTYLASSLKIDRIEREWSAYYQSDAYRSDVATARDGMADHYERQAAQLRIRRPTPSMSIADGEFLVALGLQILVITAAGIPLHAPATEEEARHWRAVRAGKKAAATRRKRRRVKAQPALRIVAGGKP